MKVQNFSASTENIAADEKPSIWNRDISFSKNKFSDKEKSVLYHQLKTLIGSGVDVKQSLELVVDQLPKKKSQEILRNVIGHLVKGASLHQAFEKTKQFSNYEIISLKIGEESGRLTEVLSTLSGYYDQRLEQRRQFVSALSYPVLIVLSSIGAVAFMLIFIIPMFEEVFMRFGSELPPITLMIINVSNFLTENVWLLMTILAGLIVGIYLLGQNEKVLFWSEGVLLKTPYAGRLFLDIQLSRCAASISLLIQASVPINQTLDFVSQMVTMRHMKLALANAQKKILRGNTLHESFGGNNIFDKSFVSLVKVGEEVNKLGEFFEKLSVEYAANATHRTKQLNTFLEPIMIVFLGLVVGLILIAMYLPMFQLSTSLELN